VTSPDKANERQPHADLDIDSRRLKALKIERLLNLEPSTGPIRLLEIGTGSGVIAHYFATHPAIRCDVSAVDVVDQRVLSDGYDFRLVHGTHLPFEDSSFDVVLSNHVIEHVGVKVDQRAHLDEIRRVMDDGGVGYLATPNRWAIIEPHFRLVFLSWLPSSLRDRYVQMLNRGDRYDCEPLSRQGLHRLLEESGFEFRNIEAAALRVANEVEPAPTRLRELLRQLSVPLLDYVGGVSPTHVRLLSASIIPDAS
jgi:SAM-dependent methyltransferase